MSFRITENLIALKLAGYKHVEYIMGPHIFPKNSFRKNSETECFGKMCGIIIPKVIEKQTQLLNGYLKLIKIFIISNEMLFKQAPMKSWIVNSICR